MAKKKSPQQPRELTSLERLGLRVSTMINAPKAQLDRKVTIHRLDTDTDEAWDGVMELIAEEEGIEQIFNDDGSVTLRWRVQDDGEQRLDDGAIELEEDDVPF